MGKYFGEIGSDLILIEAFGWKYRKLGISAESVKWQIYRRRGGK